MLISQRPSDEVLLKTFNKFTNKPIGYNILGNQSIVPKEDAFERKYGTAITTASIAGAIGLAYIINRGGKLFDFTKFVKTYVNKITANTLEKLKNSKTTDFDWLQRLKFNTAISTVNLLKKIEGIGNFNPLKDYAADVVLDKIKLKPVFDWISDKFTYYGKNLAFSKYTKPQKDFEKLSQSLNRVINFYKKTNNPTLAQELATSIESMQTGLNEIINGFDKRFDKTVDVLKKNSSREFWNGVSELKGKTLKEKIFGKLSDFCEFIPTKKMEPYKKEMFKNLFQTKRTISNNLHDLSKELNNDLDDIFYSDVLQNKTLRQSYIKIKDFLNQLTKQTKGDAASRSQIKQYLLSELENLSQELSKLKNKNNCVEKAKNMINILKNDKKGLIEEAIIKCEQVKEFSPELYMKLVSQRNNFQKSLNNAVNFETDKSYRKLLDFSLHSLATDLFTQFTGFGTMLYILLNRKKTKEQKISENLKVGIPVFGGLFVGFLCNLRQIASGPGSLLFATLSGFILNRLGTIVSKNYLENHIEEKTKTDDENKMIAKV